jgi:hypothetical protein
MPVRQLTEKCWLASWAGDTRTDKEAGYSGHWGKPDCESLTGRGWFHLGCDGLVTEGFCLSCETAHLGVFDKPRTIVLRSIVPRPLLGCWEVTCDTCATELEDDDTGCVHVSSFDAAAQAAVAYGWSVYADGRAYCDADAPPPGSGQPVILPDADQPALFGGELQ